MISATVSAPAPHPARAGGRRRGQSLVEFALVFPIFMLMLVAIFDFGLGLYSQMTVINAAREGARVGIVDPTNTNAIQDQVLAMATALDSNNLTSTVACRHPDSNGVETVIGCVDAVTGDIIEVRVDYDYHMILPLAGLLRLVSGSGQTTNAIPLSSSVWMRIE